MDSHEIPKIKFFEGNIYYIDEAARPLTFGGVYNVFNNKNEQLGSVYETLSLGQKIVRFFFGKYKYSFRFDIRDIDNVFLGSISKNFNQFGGIRICDDQDGVIGRVRGYDSDTLKILNSEDKPIATLAPLPGPSSRFLVINDLSGNVSLQFLIGLLIQYVQLPEGETIVLNLNRRMRIRSTNPYY